MTQTLFVDKSTGTFADPLLAFGLAAVVGDVLKRTVESSASGGFSTL